ncbi:MAG: matrixin family metalloprotease [Acidobacteria bacterium]|nr:matrixin family metalloprotease [Acidobacteriota bacterium]
MKKFLHGLTSLTLLALLGGEAVAYKLVGAKWADATTTFYVDIPELGGEKEKWNNAFESAMASWNTRTVFSFRIVRAVYADPCSSPEIGPRNGVKFDATVCGDSWGETTLAVTKMFFSRSGAFVQAGVLFNAERSWDVYADPRQNTTFDFRRVAVHELGHALGLAHEDNVPAIMSTFVGNVTDPQPDDIEATNMLYGSVLMASPSPCTIVFGSTCATTISWITPNFDAVQVWVQQVGVAGGPVPFANGSSKEGAATWIQAPPNRYVFLLYPADDVLDPESLRRGLRPLLSSVTVTAIVPSGTISANPNPCTIPSGGSTCAANITWTTQNVNSAEVWLRINGGAEVLFARDTSGSELVRWISGGNNRYEFLLYNTSGTRTALATVTVIATVQQPPPTTRTITLIVTNRLVYPINLFANGAAIGSVPGSATRTASAQVPTVALSLSWVLVRPRVGGTGPEIGEQMSGTFQIANPKDTEVLIVDNIVGDQWYFVPFINNRTSSDLLMEVNGGLQSQNRCNCVAPAFTDVAIGYYRLFSTSNVRAYRADSNYTGRYTYFDNFVPFVENQTGILRLPFSNVP